jgi:ABC-type transport system involved in cytochrome bd biosynthesis fused ATPase/permease subunit
LKQLLNYTIAILNRGERKKALILIGCNLAVSILDIGFLVCLLILAQVYSGAPLKISFIPKGLLDRSSLWPIAFFFLLFAVKNFVSFLVFKAQIRFRYDVAIRISYHNLLNYFEGSYSNYVNVETAAHFARVNLQPAEFSEHVMEGLQESLSQWTLIGLTVIAILLFNAKLFLLLLLILLPPVAIAAWVTRRQILAAKTHIASNRRLTMQRLEESIVSFVESNFYGKKKFFAGRYHRSQIAQNKHLAALQTMQGIPSRLAEVFAVFGLLALIAIDLVTGHGAGTGFVTLGAFLAAAYKIIPGIARILNLNGQMRAYAYTVDELYSQRNKNPEPPDPQPAEKINSMALRDLSFRYDQHYILRDFNLQIETGCFLGIDGRSGRGKTTTLHVLLGFLTPEKGTVLFNGKEVSGREQRRFWRNIAYIKQQPFILNDTLLTNIILDEESVEEQRLAHILSVSGLDTVVDKMPAGIDTWIAENGKNISGGQRQRIAIARALYKKDADVYILDEPFSELDEASEERLLTHFSQLAREGKIVILITHNKKSLGRCDRLITLHDDEPMTPNARNRTFSIGG